jgi:hypothetical protein
MICSESHDPAQGQLIAMTHILLTGAGFSRNWGGWLANECFEYLLSCADITAVIQRELWKSKDQKLGFENECLRGCSIRCGRGSRPFRSIPAVN